ncbi:hypothetical protein NKG94_18430 [Micromonospora sp. M12]
MAFAAAEVGARLVHVSSDAVHAGRPRRTPMTTHPHPCTRTVPRRRRPRRPCGRSTRRGPGAYLADPGEGSKQIQLCRDALAGRAVLFSDELRCPVDVSDLADAVLELVASPYAGLLNVAGPDAVSRAELGLLVAERFGLDAAGLTTTTGAAVGLSRPSTYASTALALPACCGPDCGGTRTLAIARSCTFGCHRTG